tara:strand:- start:199 stop:333 length:135 start_codon:yes stop_codon:yes gene_type:complete
MLAKAKFQPFPAFASAGELKAASIGAVSTHTNASLSEDISAIVK